MVEFGHFNDGQGLLKVAASIAAGGVRRAADPRGFEIILRRPIEREEIKRIAPVRGVVGWRHTPDAHLRKLCGCPACVARGEPGARKLRERYDRGEL
jgi:hypothetical protein